MTPRSTAPSRLEAVARTRLLGSPPEAPFDRLAELASELTGAPMAFVTVVDADRSFWKSCVGLALPAGVTPGVPVEDSFCRHVVTRDAALVLADVRTDDRIRDNPVMADLGVLAWAAYPVHSPDGEVVGTLCVADTVPRAWSDMDTRVMEVLSRAASSEIALRLQVDDAERETSLARGRTAVAEGQAAASEHVALVLQHSLLTPPPDHEDLDIEVRYLPAAARAQIGGDWYDAFVQPDGSTVVVVGDVVGHDIQAAAAMGQIRNLVRALSYRRAETPAQVLSAVDDVMHGLRVGAMATVVVAHVHPLDPAAGTRRLRWSSAGHLPPLMADGDGNARPLSTEPDLLLGVRPDAPRHDHEAVLDSRQTLLLFTDGLIERRDSSLRDRLRYLQEVLAELGTQALDAVCDGILDRCLPLEPEDDVAILALRVRGPGPGR